MKSNKSFMKRLRVSKRGKVIARVPGHNHFNAKSSGSERSRRRRKVGLEFSNVDRSRFLS